MKRWLKKHWMSCALGGAMIIATLPQTALAGGFELPDNGAKAMGRGGAYAVGTNDLTALHYNPARLFSQEGSNFMWNHNLIWHDASFARAPLSEGWGVEENTFGPVSDGESFFGLGGFLAASSDFGLEDWVFALGAYGPSSVGKRDYPDYGPQAFMLTDMDLLLAYYSASASYQPSNDFSVGVTLQWVDLMQMDYSVVVDASKVTSPSPLPSPSSQHTVATLQLEDRMNFTGIIGLWAALSANLEFGAAARVIPVNLEPVGDVKVDQDGLNPQNLTAKAPLTLPVQARGGFRYIHRDGKGDEAFDIELDVFYENWSVIQDFNVDLEGRINNQDTSDVVLPRKWSDTVSVRMGSDIRTIEDLLTVRLGGYWENGATPENYEHLDFPSFDRYAATLGSTLHLGSVNLTVAYAHIFQEDRNVSEEFGKVIQQRPLSQCPDGCDGLTGVVANAGEFQTSFQMLSLGLEAKFSDWF